jgi:hypothetical protein
MIRGNEISAWRLDAAPAKKAATAPPRIGSKPSDERPHRSPDKL